MRFTDPINSSVIVAPLDEIPEVILAPQLLANIVDDMFITHDPQWDFSVHRSALNIWINEHCALLTSVLGYNSDCQFTLKESRHTIYYICKYVAKAQDQLFDSIGMVAALQHRQDIERVNNFDENSTSIRRVLSMFMALTKGREVESSLAGLFFVKPMGSSSVSYCSQQYASLPVAQILGHLRNEQEVGTMETGPSGNKFFSNFAMQYIHRGPSLEQLSVVKFVMWYKLVKNKVPGQPTEPEDDDFDNFDESIFDQVDELDEEPEQEQPQPAPEDPAAAFKPDDCFSLFEKPAIRSAPLLGSHPCAATKTFKCNSRALVPEYRGPLPPLKSKLNWPEDAKCELSTEQVQEAREAYALIALSLFLPWRSASDLQLDGRYWSKFLSLYNSNLIPLHARQYLNRMDEVSSCPAHVTPDTENLQMLSTAPKAANPQDQDANELANVEDFAIDEEVSPDEVKLAAEAATVIASSASLLPTTSAYVSSDINITADDLKQLQHKIINHSADVDDDDDANFNAALALHATGVVSSFLLSEQTIPTRVGKLHAALASIDVSQACCAD